MSRTTTAAKPRSRAKATTKATAPAEATVETPAAETPAPADTAVVLTGRLTADPQLRHTATSGKPVTSIRLAVNGGEKPTFHTVVVWGRQAEVVCQYLKKGRLVEVTGRSQERTFEGKDGEQRRTTEVVAYNVQFLRGPAASQPQAEGERAVA
jgi:single-strand DNA-binding protein